MKNFFLLIVLVCAVTMSLAQTIPVFPTKPKPASPTISKPKATLITPINIEMITVGNFSIGKYEVTQAQWQAVMGNNPSEFKENNLPVEQVSWNGVQEFIQKLNLITGKNYRLPTEKEWEFAAKGGNQSMGYEYSGSNNIGLVGWYHENANHTTHIVGQKQPNELGIYDMTGNVEEWCSYWFDDTQKHHVLRGGSWLYGADGSLVAHRRRSTPADRNGAFGFRLASSL